MSNRALSTAAVLVIASLAGCATTDHSLRYQSITRGAGNAIAANTVMQMVDPWPAGVEDTHFPVPANHDQYLPADGEEGGGNADLAAGGN
jgi:hypothetical protein